MLVLSIPMKSGERLARDVMSMTVTNARRVRGVVDLVKVAPLKAVFSRLSNININYFF